MKKYILTIIIPFFIISGFCQDTDFVSTVIKRTYIPPAQGATIVEPDFTNTNSFIENIVIPNDLGSAIPMEIVYLENYDKFYVYGKRRLLVIDALTNTVSKSLPLSENSQYFPTIMDKQTNHENHFALAETNNGDFIYCSTEELELIKINPIDDTWEVVVETPDDLPNVNTCSNTMLKHDSRTNRLYWFIGQYPDNFVYVIDDSNYEQITMINIGDGNLNDIEINEDSDEFYISFNKELRVYNANNFNFVIAAEDSFFKGDLLYINHGSIHKLYCFPRNLNTVNTQINQIDFNNNNTVTSFESPHCYETSCYFNSNTEEIYIGFGRLNAGESNIYILDPNDNSFPIQLNTNVYSTFADNIPLFFKSFNNNVIVGKTNETIIIDENSHTMSLLGEIAIRNVFLNCATSPTNALMVNPWGGNIKIVDMANTIESTIEAGAILHLGCFNKAKGKAYFYSKTEKDKGKVYIYNTLSEEISIVEMGNNISDMFVYTPDENTNRVYVSFYDNTTEIKAIDGETNQITDYQYWIHLDKHYCEKMFFAPNNKLYCIVGMENDPNNSNKTAGIQILDASDGFSARDFHHFSDFPSNGLLTGEFTYNPANNNVYATGINILPGIEFKIFTEINGNTDQCNDFVINFTPSKLISSPVQNKIYVQGLDAAGVSYETSVGIFDCETSSFNQNNIEIGGSINDIEYDAFRDLVFVLHYEDDVSKLDIIDNEVLYAGVDIPKGSTSIKFNPNDLNIYCYIAYNNGNNDESEIWKCEINGVNGQDINITTIALPLENFETYKTPTIAIYNDILIDPNLNRLYVPNGGHSNISVLEYEKREALLLHEGFNWISIPRHLRDELVDETPTPIVFGLDAIEPDYTEIKVENNNVDEYTNPGDEELEFAFKDIFLPEWIYDPEVPPVGEGIMNNINSTRGYVVLSENTNPNIKYDRLLYMYGMQEDPATTIDIYCKKQNWIGYFIEEEQDVFDALADIEPDIYHIKHEDYDCWRHNFIVPDQCGGTTKSTTDITPGTWVCNGRPVIKYGEMIKVTPIEDISNFQWNYSGNEPSSNGRPEIEYFEYEKTADYETFVIELDTTEAKPTEIGAFVNDTCIGGMLCY